MTLPFIGVYEMRIPLIARKLVEQLHKLKLRLSYDEAECVLVSEHDCGNGPQKVIAKGPGPDLDIEITYKDLVLEWRDDVFKEEVVSVVENLLLSVGVRFWHDKDALGHLNLIEHTGQLENLARAYDETKHFERLGQAEAFSVVALHSLDNSNRAVA